MNPIPAAWPVFIAWTLAILAIASMGDARDRRVPNGLWLAGLIAAWASVATRPWLLDLIFLVPVACFAIGLRLRSRWGMGDAKGLLFVYVVAGGFIALTGFFVANICAYVWQRKYPGNIPFMPFLLMGTLSGALGVIAWNVM